MSAFERGIIPFESPTEVSNVDLKVPPYSIEAEMSVLGSILVEPEAMKHVVGTLIAESFYDERHRQIFSVMKEMAAGKKVIDIVTLCEELKKRELLAAVGHAEYLTELIQIVPTAAHIEAYVRIVQEKDLMRALITAATQVLGECYDQEDDPTVLLDHAEKSLSKISERYRSIDLKGFSVYGSEYALEVTDLLENERKRAAAEILTGYQALDNIFWGLHRGELIAIGARPGIGKSAFMINIATNVMNQGKVVLYFSTEMSAYEQWKRLLSIKTQLPGYKFRHADFKNQEWETLSEHLGKLYKEKLFNICDLASPKIEEIENLTRRLRPDVVIVDYLQRCTMPKASTQDLAIGEFLKALKTLSRTENCAVLLPSQFSRDIEKRTSKRPIQADFRDSGNIEQEADILMALWQREGVVLELARFIDLTILKNRHGRLGDLKISFQTETLFMPEVLNA